MNADHVKCKILSCLLAIQPMGRKAGIVLFVIAISIENLNKEDHKETKRGKWIFVWLIYGRFLSITTTSMTIIMTSRANMAAIAGTKYVSAIDSGVGVGAAVAAGSELTVKPDSE